MKKERNEFVLLMIELLLFAVKLMLATAALFGAIYVVGLIVEFLSGIVTLTAGMFLIFALCFLFLYIDFRSEDSPRGKKHGYTQDCAAVKASSCHSIRAYSGR